MSQRAIGLVGAGYIAPYHAAAVARLAGHRLAAICDRDGARARALAIRYPGVEAFDSVDALVSSQRLDAVHVLVPADRHFEVVETCLAAGVDVLVEKPITTRADQAVMLDERARTAGVRFGVGHNFLFLPVYERLKAAVRAGTLGVLREVDVVWNKDLPQVRFGPFGGWLLRSPGNVILDTGSHSIAHALDLFPDFEKLEECSVFAGDPVDLPGGGSFFRSFEAHASLGSARIHLRFSFAPGYPEHRIHVRGSLASASADFERNTFVVERNGPLMLDLDRFLAARRETREVRRQTRQTLGRVLREKMGWGAAGNPFAESIQRAIASFHLGDVLDPRLGPQLGTQVVAVAERLVARAELPGPALASRKQLDRPRSSQRPVLVLGATGFIGRELARQLCVAGSPVRALVRSESGHAETLRARGVELVAGDLSDPECVRRALEGVDGVVHLARGYGSSWEEMQQSDVGPTRSLAALSLEAGVRRFVYASSIAIYDAGRAGATITEETPPAWHLAARNPYARAKIESESLLFSMQRERGLPVVVLRPGIVVGTGGSPLHWGVGEWPYDGVVRIWGRGRNPLPFVLVEDVAAACRAAITAEGVEGLSFNLVGAVQLSAHEYLDALEQCLGVRFQRLSTPPVRFQTEALTKWLAKRVAGQRTPLPKLADVASRTSAARFAAERAARTLGWRPVADRDEFIERGIRVPGREFQR